LVTVHILATAAWRNLYEGDNPAAKRCSRWLTVIKEANLEQVEDAEYLGWIAYNAGDYKNAAHWLELSKGDTPAAYWLRAKLQRRAGKLSDAAQSMAKAWQTVRETAAYTGWIAAPPPIEDEYGRYPERRGWTFEQRVRAGLGG